MLKDCFPPHVNRNLFWKDNGRQLFTIISLIVSGRLITGNYLRILQKKIQDYYHIPLFLLNSGRSGIFLLLQTLKAYSPNRKFILLPFYICPSVIQTVEQTGFAIKFVDVDHDLNMDPSCITPEKLQNVAAVIVPHIYGHPAQISYITRVVKKIDSSIMIIDDAAAAFKVRIDNKFAGTFGDAGIISFSQGKLINASGGGILLINNPDYQHKITKFYNKLPVANYSDKLRELIHVWWRYGMHKYSDSLSYWVNKYIFSYQPVISTFPSRSRMANVDAAIAVRLLDNIDDIHRKMRAIQSYYVKQLTALSLPLKFPQFKFNSSYPLAKLCCMVEIDTGGQGASPSDLMKAYLAELGIKVYRAYEPAKNQSPDYLRYWGKNRDLEKIIILPVDHKKDIKWHAKVVRAIASFFETY